MVFIVYVLKSKIAQKSYVGFTSNIERRLEEHNSGKSNYTRKFMPWDIIHTEEFNSSIEAKKRERYLKSKVGRTFLKTIFSKLI